jgi:hypothetical protein
MVFTYSVFGYVLQVAYHVLTVVNNLKVKWYI